MTIDELDHLIARTPGAAMILLTGADWHTNMRERPLVRSRGSHADHVIYRGLPVWLTSPGPSRVLTSDQVRAEGLDDL